MKVAFRTDASHRIGGGHVMRCATLADYLVRRGHEVVFLCRQSAGDLCAYLEGRSFLVRRLVGHLSQEYPGADSAPNILSQAVLADAELDESLSIVKTLGSVDWLVVDHYDIGLKWESAMRKQCHRILVFDDEANGEHDCDILLNPAHCPGMERKYSELVEATTKKLLGVEFLLLSNQLQEVRGVVQERSGVVKKILIFYGMADITGDTRKALDALKMPGWNELSIDAVIGDPDNMHETAVEYADLFKNISFHNRLPTLAHLMQHADLALGAGGLTTYERLFLGLPAIVTTVAKNQIQPTKFMNEQGLLLWLGDSNQVTPDKLLEELQRVTSRPEMLKEQSKRGLRLIDGRGCDRVCQVMEAV